MLREVEQQGSIDGQWGQPEGLQHSPNQEIPVKGSWRNTHKRFTRKRMCNWMPPSQAFSAPFSHLPPHPASEAQAAGESKRTAKGEEAKAGLRGEDSKSQASKNVIVVTQ